MAANLREEANELGKVKKATGEAAIAMIVSMLRDLVNNGDIELKSEDDEGDG
jgi:flagellar motor switch protein FliG